MSDQYALDHFNLASHRHDSNFRLQRPLKRKIDTLVSYGQRRDFSYPSPPMSNPPSPLRTQRIELSGDAGRPFNPFSTGPPSGGPITTFVPALATTLPTSQPTLLPTFFNQPYATASFTSGPPLTFAHPGPTGSLRHEQTTSIHRGGPAESGVPGPSSSARGGRRSKTHVASACINCKRAHLSCDVQRPCARCMASGKQDTCVDVQHKKRGRPRLREEGEFRVEPRAEQGAQTASSGASQPAARPMVATRRNRAESFRSLRSQTSEDSPTYSASTPGAYASAAPLQSPFGTHFPPTPSSIRPSYEVATALLNLDFVIIRANRPFQQIMLPGLDIRGRQIADIAAPADNESFQAIRNRLRTERESREPAYMPPIVQPGQDPVERISEAEVDQYTEGFSDRSYTWTHTQLGSASQQFPVRIRLGKASSYFIVVTLPSFRPVEPPSMQPSASMYSGPLALGPPLQPPERFVPQRQTATQSAPPTAYFPFQGTSGSIPLQRPPGVGRFGYARTYPPPQPMVSYQEQPYPVYQPVAPSTPRLPIAEPPTETTAFTPRSTPREVALPPGTATRQLPPIMGSPAAEPSGAPSVEAYMQQGISEEEEEGEEGGLRSPRKRRRVGIHDVLHR